jgi:hypothetical protein
MLAVTGCGGKAEKPAAKAGHDHSTDKPGAHQEEQGHSEIGPHQGHLIELGKEQFHAELTHDDATKTITIYLLDAKAEKSVPIASKELILNLVVAGKPRQVALGAAPQSGDPEGQASMFSIVDEAALEALEAEETTGRLTVTIEGKSFSGTIEHHEHDDHK